MQRWDFVLRRFSCIRSGMEKASGLSPRILVLSVSGFGLMTLTSTSTFLTGKHPFSFCGMRKEGLRVLQRRGKKSMDGRRNEVTHSEWFSREGNAVKLNSGRKANNWSEDVHSRVLSPPPSFRLIISSPLFRLIFVLLVHCYFTLTTTEIPLYLNSPLDNLALTERTATMLASSM